MRALLVTAYDGSGFAGFQRQPGGPTVQAEIEDAATDLYKTSIEIIGASRTDAGAHALSHPVVMDVPDRYGPGEIADALNARLPDSIRVLGVHTVDDTFHPRHDALARTYLYFAILSTSPEPFLEKWAYRVSRPVDLDSVRGAVAAYAGSHDFAGFAKQTENDTSTVRAIEHADVLERGSILVFVFRAGGFLYGMVRLMVAAALAAGYGSVTVEDIRSRLGAPRPSAPPLAPAVPARGLFLARVTYEGMRLEVASPPVAMLSSVFDHEIS